MKVERTKCYLLKKVIDKGLPLDHITLIICALVIGEHDECHALNCTFFYMFRLKENRES